MSENTLNIRIQHKHDIEANWLKATTFIPKAGELIIYDVDSNNAAPRFKVGDGKTVVSNLPFSNDVIQAEVDNKVEKIFGKGLSTNDYTTTEKNKLAGITAGAKPNQNAFSKIKLGDQQIAADEEADTLNIASENITLVADVTNDKLTFKLTADNIADALGFNPGESGVQNITTGSTNGTIAVTVDNETTDVAVKGLGSAAYTNSSAYVPASRTVNGKALSSNVTLSASDVGALPNTTTIPSIEGLASTEYVDEAVANNFTAAEKTKLSGIAANAEVNQNAFSNVVVGSTTIAADSKTDSLTIAAGTGIAVTGDATNDKVTITNSGVRSIATGTANGTISVNTNGTSANVAVKGLGSAAYTDSTAYDAAGTATTKANAALSSAKTYTDEEVAALEEEFTNVIKQMYGDDLTEEGAPTIRQIANNEAAKIVDAAPDALNTLNELAAALGDDPNFATTVATQIGGKVDKVTGKGLSTNDYTTAEKNKLAGIATGATANTGTITGVSANGTSVATSGVANIPAASTSAYGVTKLSSSTSSTSEALAATPKAVKAAYDLAAQKAGTSVATTEANGLMSAADKSKLEGIAAGANAYVHPSHTAKSSGFYKVTVDNQGHVSATTAVTKADITGLGIPGSDTNTHYTAVPHAGSSSSTAATATTNGNTYINIVENGARSGGINIKGSGATTVTSDANGVITISSTDNDTKYTLPAATSSALGGVKVGSNITNSSGTISLTKANVTSALGYTPPTTNTTYSVVSTTADGLAPKRDGSTTKFLRGDGTWAVPPDNNTTYSNMTAATASAAGKAGLVPAPAAGKQASFLRGDGTWAVPTNTTYSNATTSAAGLMSATDKSKLDGIAAGANAYTHPSYTARTGKPTANQTPAFGGTATVSQITSDATGHVTAATDRTITIPSTLSNGTGTAGLIKTSSTVTSASGYTACPVISGVPYYKDTNTQAVSSVNGSTGAVTVKELWDINGKDSSITVGAYPESRITRVTGRDSNDKYIWCIGNKTDALDIIEHHWYDDSGTWEGSADFIDTNNIHKYALLYRPSNSTTLIPASANLNTITYLEPGTYFCTTAQHSSSTPVTNCPVPAGVGFMMIVYYPYDKSGTAAGTAWLRIVRKIISHAGVEYIQSVSSGSTAGTFTYNAWRTCLTSSDTAAKATADASGNNIVNTYAKKPVTYTASITTTWSGSAAPYTQDITISGMLAADKPIVDLTPSSTYATAQAQLADWGKIYRIVTAANKITVYATEKTTTALPIQLQVVR